MSEYPTHLVRRIRHKAFGAEERIVLFVLADRMKSVGDVVWPSVATIAADTGMNERTVRRVITWLVGIGVLGEREDGRRSRSFAIDFERLATLPPGLYLRARPRTLVPGDRYAVPQHRTAVPDAQTGPAYRGGGTTDHVPGTMVRSRPVPGSGKGISEGTIKEPVKEQFTARVPRRSSGQGGEVLSLDFGPTVPPTAAPVPAAPAARPESTTTAVDNLPVEPSTPPAKGNVGAKSKGASKTTKGKGVELTFEQWHLRRQVSDCWYAEFEKARGEKPAFDGRNLNECTKLLEKFDWNADMVCAIIGNAFRQKNFVEFRCKLSEILINTTQYQGTPKSERRVSSGQIEPDDNFFEQQDERLREEFGQ